MNAGYAQPLEFDDFSGGITDFYLDCALNRYAIGNNLLVKDSKKFETRPGTAIQSSTMYQIPAGQTRVSAQFLFDSLYFFYNGRNIYYQSGTWQTLQGPVSSNAALAAGSAGSYLAHGEWNKHLILTSDSFGSPMKLFRDSTGTAQIRNAGLPKITLTACIALANQIKSKFNIHIASAIHTSGIDTADQVTSADAYDLPSLLTLTAELLTRYTAHNADANLASAWHYHAAQQVGTHVLLDGSAPQVLADCKSRLDDLKTEYNAHDADATAHSSGSTQQVAKYSAPQISSAGGTGNSFIYTFVAFFEYTVGTTTYDDLGPTYQVTLTNVGAPNANTVTISQIPVIANGSTENYDTSNIKWYIYRTAANGTTSYYLGNVTNGTTTYADTLADASLILNAQIYTSGGVMDNDPPPQAKYVVQANDIMWYGHVKEGNLIRKSRIRQSAKFDPDSCPESSFLDLEDEITGMGAIGIYPVIFCKRRIYRIEGFRDDQGRGVITKQEISRTIGSVNHQSIVNTLQGIFFAGNDGFYYTDGFQVQKISSQIRDTYLNIVSSDTQKARIYGTFEIAKNRVHWSCMSVSGSSDNDKIFTLHLNFGVSPECCFTTSSANSSSWNSCSIGFDASSNFILGDSRGYLFQFGSNLFDDPKIDVSKTPDQWITSAIVYDYEGPAISFGTKNSRKFVSNVTFTLENQTNMSVQVASKNDDRGVFTNLRELRYRENLVWLDPDVPIWEPTTDGYPWEVFPLITAKRRMRRQNLRCLYKQIQFTNSLTITSNSDTYGVCNVTNSSSQASLNTYPTTNWPTDCVDYYISFEADGYTQNYLITGRTNQTLTFLNISLNAPTNATSKWVIRGIKRNERFNLVAYTLEWTMVTSSHRIYRADTGGNA